MRSSRQLLVVGLLTAIWACDGVLPPPTEPENPGPTLAISDGARGGNPHFYFLKPFVARDPTSSGVFDPAAVPTVELCELVNDECVLPLLAAYQLGSGVVLDEPGEKFTVNWPVGDFALDTAKFYRASVKIGEFVLGYADLDVVSTGKEAKALRDAHPQEFVGVVLGRDTLPIRFRIEVGAVPQPAWCGVDLGFDDEILPPGWTLVPFGTGPFYANGRLQAPPQSETGDPNVPRLDAPGSLVLGTQEVVVDFDGNISSSGAPAWAGRGQGRLVSFVMESGWSIEAQQFNDRDGANVHTFRAQTNIPQWPAGSDNYYHFDITQTVGVPYGLYHFTAAFRDGQVTWYAAQTDGVATIGPVVQPLTGFLLSQVRSFSLGIGAGLAEAAWADNLSVRCNM